MSLTCRPQLLQGTAASKCCGSPSVSASVFLEPAVCCNRNMIGRGPRLGSAVQVSGLFCMMLCGCGLEVKGKAPLKLQSSAGSSMQQRGRAWWVLLSQASSTRQHPVRLAIKRHTCGVVSCGPR
jgi:hypothetical protein